MFVTFLWRHFGFLECSKRDGLLRFTWMQLVLAPGIGAKIHLWHRDNDRWQWGLYLHPLFFELYLNLWWSKRVDWPNDDYVGLLWWGFDWRWSKHDHMIFWFGWPGKQSTLHEMPWSWQHIQTQHLSKTAGWVTRQPVTLGVPYLDPAEDPDAWVEKLPFTYVLKSGKVQHRVATVTARRAEHRWKISKALGLKWPRQISTSIDITFDDEVGERSGSWKGGTIGCSWSWREGQTFRDALMDMQLKRKL